MFRCALVCLLVCNTGYASSLFDDDSVLDMTLEGPLSTLKKDTRRRNEHGFHLTTEGATIDVAVRVRGISRVVVCNFPPLRLNFSSSDSADTVFSGQKKLKLVTHCKNRGEYEQNVLEEYAAYRILNVLSDVSLRTRLVRIRYVNTEKRGATELVRYAFFIESEKAMAERNGGALLNIRRVTKNYLDQHQAGLAYIFQYLIGNTDWGLVRAIDKDKCCHNVVLADIEGRHYVVPYDFDRAGLVNARYAKPHPDLKIRRVTQRWYRGYCMSSEPLREALETVVRHRQDITGVIDALPALPEKEIKSRSDYLQKFFKLAADQDKLMNQFESRCL